MFLKLHAIWAMFSASILIFTCRLVYRLNWNWNLDHIKNLQISILAFVASYYNCTQVFNTVMFTMAIFVVFSRKWGTQEILNVGSYILEYIFILIKNVLFKLIPSTQLKEIEKYKHKTYQFKLYGKLNKTTSNRFIARVKF